MNVKIAKLNSGISFTLLNQKGEPTKRTPSNEKVLQLAASWYMAETCAKLAEAKFGISSLLDAFAKPIRQNVGWQFELEPWGFALVNEKGEPVMGDSGSFPAESRAKRLACYQACLNRVETNGSAEFFIVRDF